jgi:hypothetical protein
MRRERDPVTIHAGRLENNQRSAIETDVDSEVIKAFQQALSDPLPTPEHLSS